MREYALIQAINKLNRLDLLMKDIVARIANEHSQGMEIVESLESDGLFNHADLLAVLYDFVDHDKWEIGGEKIVKKNKKPAFKRDNDEAGINTRTCDQCGEPHEHLEHYDGIMICETCFDTGKGGQ